MFQKFFCQSEVFQDKGGHIFCIFVNGTEMYDHVSKVYRLREIETEVRSRESKIPANLMGIMSGQYFPKKILLHKMCQKTIFALRAVK